MSEHLQPRPDTPTTPDRFYPIVPDLAWLQRIVPLGVKTVQLRLKDAPAAEIDTAVRAGKDLCAAHGCQFIVNDYWQAALEYGVRDVHLGQEDLADADLDALHRAGVRLGISTHTEAELETALGAKPAYVALGPIYETKLKAMRYGPQGLERIATWRSKVGQLPLIAIGGLTPERASAAMAAGADSASVITDFLTHSAPEERIAQWLSWAADLSR
ncbi:MAG: thiamine phosphate synthase [Pseudomonadota bacterium]